MKFLQILTIVLLFLFSINSKANEVNSWLKTESDKIIEELTERMIVSGAEYTHTWQVGDIVIWDNRCLVHKAAGNYSPAEDRIHWRLSIKESVVG